MLVSEGHCGDWAAAGHAGEPLQSPTGAFLLDIMVLFFSGNLERVTSRGMVEWLNRRGERPWRVLTGGKAVSEVWLAGRLRLYGIRPRTLRVEGVVSRGYAREDFLETFKRYISRAEWDELRR